MARGKNVNPFELMRLDAETKPPGVFDRDPSGKCRLRFVDWAAYMWIRDNWKRLGATKVWSMVNRDGRGLYYVRRMQKFGFLPAEQSA